jgi:hypothetical protein
VTITMGIAEMKGGARAPIVGRLLLCVLLGASVAVPPAARACERCFGASGEQVQQAYVTGFFILSGLALSVVAFASFLLYRWHRKERQHLTAE